MISTQQDFEEGTAFELYVLETVRPAIEQHGGAYVDLRGSKTVAAVSISITENLSGAAVDRLKDQLAPLLFGAAWKVLDLLLEFALNRAGLTPARHNWVIAEKQQHALADVAIARFWDVRSRSGRPFCESTLRRLSTGIASSIGQPKWMREQAPWRASIETNGRSSR